MIIYHIHPAYPWRCGSDTGILTTNASYVNCPDCLAKKALL